MVNPIFNCWQTLNMFPLSLWSWNYSYNLPGTVASEAEWAGMSVFYQYCIKMLLHFQYSLYSSLTWCISIAHDKIRCRPFSHFSYNVFNVYGDKKKDIREYKPSVSSVDIKSYRTGNFYIGQEYGIPHADIPFSIEILLHSSLMFLL